MKKVILLLCCLLPVLAVLGYKYHPKHKITTQTKSKKKDDNSDSTDIYFRQWRRAEELLTNQRPKLAAALIDSIYKVAKSHNEPVIMLKAEMYFMVVTNDTSENGTRDNILLAEKRIAESAFPFKAIWQSIAARMYWDYYQEQKYEIMERTSVEGPAGDDFEQWDARRFFDKISSLFGQSMLRAGELKNIPLKGMAPVLSPDDSTGNLRPTLYDLLANRALSYYENDEKDITNPAFAFVMDDEAAFASAPVFTNRDFKTADTASMQYQALQIYKSLLTLHKYDEIKDALIDADLHRLEFVYRHSVLDNKKRLYLEALHQLAEKYKENQVAALAAYRELMVSGGFNENDYNSEGQFELKGKEEKIDFPALASKLKSIMATWPGSLGGRKAQALLTLIDRKTVSFETEKEILPSQPSKILVEYRNVSRVYVRVMKSNYSEYRGKLNRDGLINKIRTETPLQNFSVALPGTDDKYKHSTEVKIDPLPPGLYYIYLSYKNDFSVDTNLLIYQSLQVTRLSYIHQNDGYAHLNYVLNRETGVPVKDADIYFKNNNSKEPDFQAVSGDNGSFDLTGIKSRYPSGELIISQRRDSLFTSFSDYSYNRAYGDPMNKTWFFTDRAIYRPGQTIFFKGIMARVDSNGRNAKTVANEKTKVEFYDPNNQKINSLELTTNEFGSFTGQFKAPEGGLTGEFRIRNETRMVSVNVEEYKRPKFEVVFDTLKNAAALNDRITVTGKVSAFAGSSIDGAKVKYHVTRKTKWDHWRYWYGNRPNSPEMEMAKGEAKTDADGKFNIEFTAMPDREVDRKTLPVFTYEVSVDVTDLNGETHSGSKTITVGYVSVSIKNDIPELALPSELDTLNIRTENLEGEFIPGTVRLKISRLKSPDQVYRKRLWKMPDEFVMDEAAYRKDFPLDEYKEEGDYKNWPVEAVVYNENISTRKDGIAPLNRAAWSQNGWYLVEMTTKDKNGTNVTDKKYVEVWDTHNPGSIMDPLIMMPAYATAQPGDLVQADFASRFKNGYVIRQEINATGKLTTSGVEMEGKPSYWRHRISESDRGGLMFSLIMLKDNRVYTQKVNIKVPWTNKDLKLTWETHRDKLLPGAKETWTVTIKGNKKEKVAAELLATLYDASLDELSPHDWAIDGLYPVLNSRLSWSNDIGYQGNYLIIDINKRNFLQLHGYQDLIITGGNFSEWGAGNRYARNGDYSMLRANRGEAMGVASDDADYDGVADYQQGAYNVGYYTKFTPPVLKKSSEIKEEDEAPMGDSTILMDPVTGGTYEWGAGSKARNRAVQMRKNLNETAFFYPQLKTDEAGNVKLEFPMPEALTKWKFLALAHTGDMAYGKVEGTVKTQKELMVFPGLPRFLRQGDEIVLSAKVSNLSQKAVKGKAKLQILDAETLKPLNSQFKVENEETEFSAKAGQSAVATWNIKVPGKLTEPVVIRISAANDDFTDGEENTLPVISNRMMVTETMPMWVNGNGDKAYRFDKLLHSDSSKTLSQYGLTLEYTSNPAWYAILALPYLMEFPHECAEQTFNRYYANALAAYVAHESPKAEKIFNTWQNEDTAALLSNLDKNEELKSALVQETPWVAEAKTETEQRHRIALLFETHKLAASQRSAAKKLQDMQMSSGGFPWFSGSNEPDRYITQYIVTGIGRLQHLGVKVSSEMNEIATGALPYLDKELKKEYDNLKREKADMKLQHINNETIQYLYMRSFFGDIPIENGCGEAYKYYLNQAVVYQATFNSYMRGMIALALNRAGNKKASAEIISSLKEVAHHSEEMGMYWKNGNSWWWYEAPVEEQALLIECFNELTHDISDIDAMKLWLLKQKQTQNWPTTKATADACYALLITGSDWLRNDPQVTIELGKENIKSSELSKQKGTGYFKVHYDGTKVKPDMGAIKVKVEGNEHSTSWGAVYWQYFENLDKISSAATGIVVKKKYFINQNGDRGKELIPVTEKNTLKIGDKVTVRIEIIADRDMDYVHLKDMRASCFEPINVISQYKYQGGLGYYESTKDASSNFFISHLAKGKYVFEYPMYVTHSGNFSGGIATLQCMYAPEFSSHSEGMRIKVAGGE